MSRFLLSILVFLLASFGYSQINFEKGYFINNSGEKIQCLIKNKDWKNNPEEFLYKLSEDQEIKRGTLAEIQEFVVIGRSKFIRVDVDVDQSSDLISDMSNVSNPVFVKRRIFLRVLVEGNASLYQYSGDKNTRFFYSTDHVDLQQLIYKQYKNEYNEIFENKSFRQQLKSNLSCGKISDDLIKKTEYKKIDLVDLFSENNSCLNSNSKSYSKTKKGEVNFSIKLGLSSFSMLVLPPDEDVYGNIDFGNKSTFRFGAELEYVFPFNKNKWALVLEPSYHSYEAETEKPIEPHGYHASVKYKSIDISLGARHYMFLSTNTKIYINAFYVAPLKLGDYYLVYEENIPSVKLSSTNYLSYGLGVKLYDKFSAEFRIHDSRDVFSDHHFWGSDYKGLSFIVGYTIF